MNCESLEGQIALTAEGDLPAVEAAELESHLAGCRRCREFAESMAESQRALKDLAEVDLDPAALAEVRGRVRQELDRPPRGLPLLVPLAAGLVAAVLIAALWRGPGHQSTPSAAGRPSPVIPPVAAVVAPESPRPAPLPTPRAFAPPRTPRSPGSRMSLTARALVNAEDSTQEEPPPVIKLVTRDPDVIIFWSTERNGGEP